MPNLPRPVQSPRPPIHVGGIGPRRTLPIVARYADVWNVPTYGLAGWEESARLLGAECEAIGRDPATIRRSLEGVLVLAQDEAALEESRAKAERRYARATGGGWRPGGFVGTPPMVVDRIADLVEQGITTFVFFTYDRAEPRTLELFADRVMPDVSGDVGRRRLIRWSCGSWSPGRASATWSPGTTPTGTRDASRVAGAVRRRRHRGAGVRHRRRPSATTGWRRSPPSSPAPRRRGMPRASASSGGASEPTPAGGRPRHHVRHFVATHQIDLEDETHARGRSYFVVIMPHGVDHWGRYLDEYGVRDGRWLITRRRAVSDGRTGASFTT